MFPKSILTLEGVHSAAPMTVFVETDKDGNLNYDRTRGSLSVYCNKHNPNNNAIYPDLFEIRVAGEKNIRTIANHVYKGKGIDRVTAFVTMPAPIKDNQSTWAAIKWDRKKGCPATDDNGNYIPVSVPKFYLQSVELGGDTEEYQRQKGEEALNAAKKQGTLHPKTDLDTIMDIVLRSRATKQKSENWSITEALETGRFKYAKLWSNNQFWQPKNKQSVDTQPKAPDGIDPDELAKFFEWKRQQEAQTQTTSQAESETAPNPTKIPDEDSYPDIPF